MIMSARYSLASNVVTEVAHHWVGRPKGEDELVYALFEATGDVLDQRWYVYTSFRDAVSVNYDNLPEAVRLAYMLVE